MWQGLYISVLGGLVLLCLVPLASPLFSLFKHDPLVQENEVKYFQILALGGFPVIASSAFSGFFAGLGRPWPVMWISCSSTAVNLILAYILVFGKWGFPEMGISGAGLATLFAGIFSFFIYLVLVYTKANDRAFRILKGWRFNRELFFRLLRFGLPSGVQFFLDIAGFTIFVLLVGRLGTQSLAATNIAFNINTLAFMPMIGFGIAVSVLVGQYMGKNRPDLAESSVYSGFHMTFLYMTTVAAAYMLIPKVFVAPFASQASAEDFAEIYRVTVILLRFVAVYSVFDTMNIIFASALKGAGDTRYVMFMIMVISGLVLVIPTFLFIIVLGYGLMASWTVASIYVIILAFSFYLRFLGGKWKSMRVIEAPSLLLPAGYPESPGDKLEPSSGPSIED